MHTRITRSTAEAPTTPEVTDRTQTDITTTRHWAKLSIWAWGFVLLGGGLLFWKRGSISKFLHKNVWLCLSLSADDYKQYDKLLKIEIAYRNNLAYFESIKGDSDSTSLTTKLGALSVDNDYIFNRLDEVRGGETIKAFRKQVVDNLNKLSEDIDIRTASLGNNSAASLVYCAKLHSRCW